MIRIFHHYISVKVVLQMIFDFFFVLGATAVIGSMYVSGVGEASTVASHSLSLATWTFVVGSVTGIYQGSSTPALQQSVTRALVAAFLMVPLAYGLFRLMPGQLENASTMPYAAVGVVLAVIAYRTLTVHFGSLSTRRARLLVLGTGAAAKQVRDSLAMSNSPFEIVGYIASPNEQERAVPASQVMAASASLAVTAANAGVEEVVVALAERRSGSMSLRELLDCKISGIRVSDVATHFEKRLGQIKLDHVNAGWLIFGDGFNQGLVRTTVKRAFDVVCAALLLTLTLPLMLLTMVLIAVDSRGPIFYRQERVGLNGKTFEVIKFRSMRSDAEQDGQPRWASASDDRVTRIGRLMRLTRIDELPQLYNVLKGEMSLVGPRPERPFFVESLTKDIPYYAVRHSVKPGLTGWAQVRFQYGSSLEDTKHKLQYDLYYVKNHTLFLDLLIMFETVSVVLTGKGAR